MTDKKKALKWSRKAAEGGDDDAQTRLGDAYEGGLLGPKIDNEMALMWFKKAAEGVATTTRNGDSGMPTGTAP